MPALLMRLLLIWLALMPLLPPPSAPLTQDPATRPRLEKLNSWGEAPTALTMQGANVFIAEGSVLKRAYFDESGVMQTDYTHDLGYGRILDLVSTSQALYALTAGNLLTLNPTGDIIQQAIRQNGYELNLQGQWLLVRQVELGAIYQIQADNTLLHWQNITSKTDLQAVSLLPTGQFVKAEAKHGVSWQRLTSDGIPLKLGDLTALQNVNQIATQNSWTYTARGHTVDIINTNSPAQPTVSGFYTPFQDVQDMAWQNGYLVIADATAGLKVYQAPDLFQPPLYLNSQRGAPAEHVVWTNQTIIASRPDHIEFYDANQLPTLNPIFRFPVWDKPTALLAMPNSNRVLVGLGASGIAVLDFTNASNPQLLGAIRFSAGVTDLFSNPNDPTVIHILLDEGRLTTVRLNFADLNASTILSDLPIAGQPTQMAYDAARGVLAVASGRAGTYFFRLNGTDPELLLSYSAHERMTQIAVNQRGEWLIVDSSELLLIELQNNSGHLLAEMRVSPSQTGRLLNTPQGILWGRNNQLNLFNANANHLMTLMDYQPPTQYHALMPQGDYLLLANDAPANGVTVLNIANPQQPYEQAMLTTPFLVEDWAMQNGRLLLSNSQHGIMQWQGDLATIAGNVSPEWLYQMPSQLTTLTQQTQRGAIGQDGRYFYQAQNGVVSQNLPAYRQLTPISNGWLGIDAAYHLMRILPDGNLLAQNTTHAFERFVVTQDGILWAMDVQGNLQAVNLATLQPLDPLQSIRLNTEVSALASEGEYLLLGTMDGRLLRITTPRGKAGLESVTIAQLSDLGGAIQSIQPQGTDLLVSAGRGGVWWLDASQPNQFTVKSHYQPAGGSTTTVAFSPSHEWLAVALNTCGMAILDARQPTTALPLYAQWLDGIVTDVSFLSETDLLAVVDGVPTRYRFDSAGQPLSIPLPTQPNPPDRTPIEAPIAELSWHIPAAECQNLSYEVSLNGQVLAETTQPHLALTVPLYYDATWQVNVRDAAGHQVSGHEWQIYTESQGWQHRPLNFRQQLNLTEQESSSSWRWLLLAGMALMVGVLGIWMVVQRYIGQTDSEDDFEEADYFA